MALDAEGIPVGYVGCQTVLDEGYITNVAVSPDHRRRGIASLLLQALAHHAMAQGACLCDVGSPGFQCAGLRSMKKRAMCPLDSGKTFIRAPSGRCAADDVAYSAGRWRNDMKILAIESSCDETAAAVIEDGRRICSNAIDSQVETRALYGGVVPEIASRGHMEAVVRVTEQALSQSGNIQRRCGRSCGDLRTGTHWCGTGGGKFRKIPCLCAGQAIHSGASYSRAHCRGIFAISRPEAAVFNVTLHQGDIR